MRNREPAFALRLRRRAGRPRSQGGDAWLGKVMWEVVRSKIFAGTVREYFDPEARRDSRRRRDAVAPLGGLSMKRGPGFEGEDYFPFLASMRSWRRRALRAPMRTKPPATHQGQLIF